METRKLKGGTQISAGRRLALGAIAVISVVASGGASATNYEYSRGAGNQLEVSVVDRESGEQAILYRHQGSVYVAGVPGSKYAIRIRNKTNQRLLAVMAVDGVNIITGQTGSYEQSGYVLNPWQTQEIAGWRKNRDEVAGFVFTALPDSYAARTGRPNDVGVIGVAVFVERAAPRRPEIFGRAEDAQRRSEASSSSDVSGNASGGPRASAETGVAAPTSRADEKLGTGHGDRENSRATRTTFVRESSSPAEVVSIQYDSMVNLVRAGVVVEPKMARPRPFPKAERGYVADPPTH